MALQKKIKKLKKNPKQFFKDMKIFKKKNVDKVQTKKKTNESYRNDFLEYRTLKNQLELKEKFYWKWYQEINNKNRDNLFLQTEFVLIFPSGDNIWDSYIVKSLESKGYLVYFFNIWDYFVNGNLLHIDDMHYIFFKEPLKVVHISMEIVDFIQKYNIKNIVLSDDIHIVNRFIVKQCKRNKIQTKLIPYNDNSLGNLYKQSNRFPVSNEIIYLFQKPCSMENLLINETIKILKNEQNIHKIDLERFKQKYAIEQNDNVIIIFLPIIFVNTLDYIEQLELFLEKYCSDYEYNKHIIIISSNKVVGKIKKILDKYLTKFFKKTIIFRHQIDDINIFFKISKYIFAVQGVEKYLQNFDSKMKLDKHIFLSFNNKKDENIIDQIKDQKKQFDLVVIPDQVQGDKISDGRQRYLNILLNTRNRKYALSKNIQELLDVDYFLQWGAEPNENKSRAEVYRTLLKQNKLYVEDGFIRSVGLWTDEEEPTLSIVMDTLGIYYDATKETLLENRLNSNFKLNNNELLRARSLINKIVSLKISKYNYAPKLDLPFLEDKKRILLVDQKAGDMSLKYGLADEKSFDRMLEYALSLGDTVEIIIKQHPCAITGDEDQAHYTEKKLGEIAKKENIHLIAFDINPYSLINSVDEVYVVSSGMGFEALMAKKPVTCFGAPFYSNWGLTIDKCNIDRRKKKRSLEDIFYIFYILLSSYISPETMKQCELEDLINYIDQQIKSC